jgi:hypothetical protein
MLSAFAGTTGKLAGKVVDARTKEPLAGTNVVLDGSLLGASADADGDYFVINVPVGTYSVTVSYVGYQSIQHAGVKIIMDQTTKLNFELSEEAVSGETIVVVGEAFKVQKDETSKKITIQAEEIQSMPVKDFSEMITAQAGVVQIESSVQGISGFQDRGIEEIHVRGGRSGEIGYTIDGMYIVNPFYGSKYSWTELNDFAVEQVDMKTGVFDAEYGGAMSSMINIITRDGGEKLQGNFRVSTSNIDNIAGIFENNIRPEDRANLSIQKQDYLRDFREIGGGLGGPIPFTQNKMNFILNGHKLSSAYAVYKFDNLVYDRDNPDNPQNAFVNQLDTISGWHNMGFRHSWDVYGKLSWKMNSSMKLSASFWNLSTLFRSANLSNFAYQYYEAGRNIATQTSDRQSLMFNHQLSSNTFYDLRISRFYQKMFIGNTDDGTADGTYLSADKYLEPGYDPNYEKNPFWYEFYVSGHDRYYHTNFAETYEGFFTLISQLSKHHQIKTGASYRQHTIYINEIQLPWLLSPYKEQYKRHPEEGALYIQDLIEYEYMTIHIGMRLDVLNARSDYWVNPWAKEKELVNSKWEYNWSPRLGFSHVITDNATFTFGYGQFTQTPTYRNKYINPKRDIKTSSPIVGNASLSMEKMTAYEFGVNVGITDNIIAQAIGWSKEYSGLTSTERIPQFPYSYTTMLNTDYATARGMDLVLRRKGKASSLILQYTYSRATANRRDPWEGYRSTDTPRTMPKREILMSYDRTHDLSVYYAYTFVQGGGPDLFEIKPLERSRLDLMFLAISGFPYTPVIGNVAGETNSERGPWNYTANFNYRRSFTLGGIDLILGVMVQNLFNWENEIDIWAETGKADDPGARLKELIEEGVLTTTYFDQPYRYSRPREIDFSLEIAF